MDGHRSAQAIHRLALLVLPPSLGALALAGSVLGGGRVGGLDGLVAPRRRGALPSTRLVLEIPTMRECRDVPDIPFRFYNVRTSMKGKSDFVLNGNFNVSREPVGMSEININLTKCQEVVTSNTCEHFQTWRFNKDACHFFFSNRGTWTKFRESVVPKPSCPTKMGTYSIRDATLDMKLLQAIPLPLEGNVWFVTYMTKEANGRPHACIDLEMRFHRIRDS